MILITGVSHQRKINLSKSLSGIQECIIICIDYMLNCSYCLRFFSANSGVTAFALRKCALPSYQIVV